VVIFGMILLAALLETLGIGFIVPFVQMVVKPSIITDNKIISFFYNLFHFHTVTSFLIFTAIMLLFFYVIKNLYLVFFQYVQNTVILNQQTKLAVRLYKSYLTKPYTFHLQRNSSELLRNINEEVRKVLQGMVLSTFQLLTELFVITCILILLLTISPIATSIATILLGSSVFLFFKFFRKKTNQLGKEQQMVSGRMIKWIHQGLGASKEIKVMGKEEFFVNEFTKEGNMNAKISRYRMMLEQTPRLYLETVIISIVLVIMLIIIIQGNDATSLVSTMALFTMAAFRLMPSLNRIMAMLTTIRFNHPALTAIYDDLISSEIEETSINMQNLILSKEPTYKKGRTFSDSIQITDVSFLYPNQTEYSIKNVSLTIPIGKSVAFIGESGAGKTTLVDLILGVHQPEEGKVLIDGKNLLEIKHLWQQKIGYIPQSIYLSDDSIRGNVAFGVPPEQIDNQAVWRALEQAQLKGFVEELPGKLETYVGERGIRLSGGQRQRIGIARALYHNPEILFMDEATSALDNETEKEFLKSLENLKGEKTLIIIAHRLTTIEDCDIVFKISKGSLEEVTYKREKSYFVLT